MLKTNPEWIEWGSRDPLFGVASWKEKGIGSAAPWTNEEFYAVGESDWNDFNEHWMRYGYIPGVFVEIGCGAGRITKQLSSAFKNGHALDVSKDMIAYASKNLTAGNVEWHVTTGLTIPLNDASVDAAFSCHVLQHLPNVDAGYTYFREVFRTLKPGGSLMIHLPVHVFPAAVSLKFAHFCDALYKRVELAVDAKSTYQRARMKAGAMPPMHGISFDLEKLYRALVQMSFKRVEFATFATTSNGNLHTFVFATKP